MQPKVGKMTFSNKGLKHEINFLCKYTPKNKVLDQYLHVIQKEKARLKQRALKHKKSKAADYSDTSSDMNLSVNLIEEISPT